MEDVCVLVLCSDSGEIVYKTVQPHANYLHIAPFRHGICHVFLPFPLLFGQIAFTGFTHNPCAINFTHTVIAR